MLAAVDRCTARIMLPGCAGDVYSLLRVPAASGAESTLRKSWLTTQNKPCKDVVALAMPFRRVPTTLEAFKSALATNSKGADWVLSSWYIVYVGAADGREWGWSNAPYDQKKRLTDTKPLYSTDAAGPYAGQTRFWSFMKVANNMNKGARCEQDEGQDLSFVLPAGTCFSHFLREDSYGDKPLFICNEEQQELQPYEPVLLQLSSTNNDQAGKGNGLKLRRVLPVAASVLSSFFDSFYARKQELEEAQQRASSFTATAKIVKGIAGCPLLCKVDRNAFWYHDETEQIIEILDSGVDAELGSKLVVPQSMLLKALHSVDIGRALRMFTVALGHGAVKCIVTADKADDVGICRVVHLHVDVAEALWLSTLQKSRNASCLDLPSTSLLCMCIGAGINEDGAAGQNAQQHVLWFSPSIKVPMATVDGQDVPKHIVFEMSLAMKNVSGQREVSQKTFLMDGVEGLHYVVKIFHVDSVELQEAGGLTCKNAELLLSWQLRPGLGAEAGTLSQHPCRKRQFVQADATDHDKQDKMPKHSRSEPTHADEA